MENLLSSVPAASKLFHLQITWRSCLVAAPGFNNFFPGRGKLGSSGTATWSGPARNNLTLPDGASPSQYLSISDVCSQDAAPSCLRGEAVSAGFFLRPS